MRQLFNLIFLVCLTVAGALSKADGFTPEIATTERLPDYQNQHWVWAYGMRAPSQSEGRGYLLDEAGEQLGQVSGGFWFNTIINAPERGELITLETYFSRGTRGERTDVAVVYDPKTLSPIREVVLPPKRLNSIKSSGLAELTEDERFLLVVNYTPAQSITVVDLNRHEVVDEVETPGCSVIYAAGNRDFYSICGNGGFMQIKLGDDGKVVSRTRSVPLFDPVNDFLTIDAARIGDTWYFVSRENNVYAVRMAGDTIELSSKWSLVTDDEREDEWLISGLEGVAAHEPTGQLYVLMHQGGRETFEQPGTHVWVYDVGTESRVQEIALEEMSIAIDVSQHENPRLYALDFHIPLNMLFTIWMVLTEGESSLMDIIQQRVNAYDALSGRHLFASATLPEGIIMSIKAW